MYLSYIHTIIESLLNYANPWVVEWPHESYHVTVTCEDEERGKYYIYLKFRRGYKETMTIHTISILFELTIF